MNSPYVKAKKFLGQHFLKDENTAISIVNALPQYAVPFHVIEVGPGMGVLTKYLLERKDIQLKVAEIDRDSVAYLKLHYTQLHTDNILEKDFLKLNFSELFNSRFAVIGNFPYNISSQILFKVLENRNQVDCCIGMFQKEVAQRIAASEGNKTYGILSVLCQAFFQVEYLFTVSENVFVPPPKVKSAVIRLTRKWDTQVICNHELFFKVVKTAFNQRRKTLRNALKPLLKENIQTQENFRIILSKRAEQLSVNDFIELTLMLESQSES